MTRPTTTSLKTLLLTVACIAIAACEPGPDATVTDAAGAAAPAGIADTVFVNGRIYTVDGMRSWAEAVAVVDGRISFVGTDEGAEALVGPETRRIDLGGRMMLPGLHDSHVHPLTSAVERMGCDLGEDSNLDGYLETIRECAGRKPDDPWVFGSGWSMDVFGPGAKISKALLDEIEPDRPVYLESADGHTAWVNSKALEIAGITADTPDPDGGLIDRDPDSGDPIGTLQETAADLVEVLYPITPEMRIEGLESSIRMLNGYGVTSVQDAKVGEFDLDGDLAAYRTLDERGELSLRVVTSMYWHRDRGVEQIVELERQRAMSPDGRVRATTVKIFQDGVMENFTAAMLEPYIGQGGTRGLPRLTPSALKEAVTALDAAGFQVHFHAIGDAAIRQSLDAVEAARKANGSGDNRHHISHLQLIDPDDIERFRTLGVVANFQPLWACADSYIKELTLPFLGPSRSRWLYPIASVYTDGGMIAFGSDWSVSTANPFPQMQVAITRKCERTDDVFIPEELISLPEAIAAFTINGAYVNHSERDTGSIEVGKYADLIVLDRNLFDIDVEEISETKVLLTLVEGEVVFGDVETL